MQHTYTRENSPDPDTTTALALGIFATRSRTDGTRREIRVNRADIPTTGPAPHVM